MNEPIPDPLFANTASFPQSPDADATLAFVPDPSSEPPQLGFLGQYQLLGEVARGGMGVVYKAVDRKLNRTVALKVTRAGPLASFDEAKRFQTEAEAAAKLDHPHIVPIYEVGEADGIHFISMAFVEGTSLAERVSKGPLPPREAAALLRSVAAAVAYAHSQGVIHRDLKPGNIMLDAADTPRVTDFGLAKRTDADSSLTQAGQVMGTPNYMPPEQAEGKNEQVGPLADVYSLGATLYCLITGRPPFTAASMVDTLKQVVEREPVSPRSLNHSVDRDLDTIVLKCLQKKPEKRYASATALVEDLQRYLDRRPIQARPVGDVEKMARWCGRNPLLAASMAGIVAIFVMAFVLVSWSYVRADEARREEEHQREAAQDREKAERWERYRANMIAAGGALQLHNVGAARDALEAAPEEHRNWEWHYFSHQLDTAREVIRLGDRIQAIAISPDGMLAVVQPADGPSELHDLQPFTRSAAPPTRTPASAFRFSPDGSLLACEFPDRISIWDVHAARERAVVKLTVPRILDSTFSPDGSRLAVSCADNTVRVLDAATGRERAVLRGHELPSNGAKFSPDGKRILTAGGKNETARIWNAETGDPIHILPGTSAVGHAIYNPKGDRIVTVESYPSNLLRLWDAESGRMIEAMRGHANAAEAVAYSPDGSRIASGGISRTIHLWDGRTGKPVSSRDGHRDRVQVVGFSPDGKTTITAATDRTVRLWKSLTGAPLAVLHGHTGPIIDARYSADGRTIVTASVAEGAIRLWDARSAERNAALRDHEDFVYDVAFHPDGERVASASWDGTIRIWNATTGRETTVMRLPPSPQYDMSILNTVAIHPDGAIVASGGRDRVVRLWDVETGKQVHQFGDRQTNLARNSGDPRVVRFSPSGEWLASGWADGAIRIMDVKQRLEIAAMPGTASPLQDLAFSPDGTWLASAGFDHTVRIWDFAGKRQLHVLEGHGSEVFAVAISRDGKWLASSSADGTARIWDTSTWKQVEVLKHGTNVFGVAFTPDGSRLACACANNLIRLWDMKTFKLVGELDGHQDYVHQIAFSPDGTRLVSGSGDKTVRIWDSLSVPERAKRATR